MKKLEVLKKKFGYSSFRTGQEEIIDAILKQKNVLAMLPTGTGKSLCYQLPAYLLEGTTIIVSPLISLMQDQVEQLKMLGEKRVIALNSFLDQKDKWRALKNLNYYRFVFISPEMLSLDAVITLLKKVKISLFVVDEAHCISQWGYDFRPDYLNLGHIRELLGNPLTLALTATAAQEVRNDIKTLLHLSQLEEIIYTIDRPNIALAVEQVQTHQDKRKRILELVRSLEKPGILYFSSKRQAEEVTEFLKENGFPSVAYYHGGREQDQRIIIQQQFLHDQIQLICATSAFGLGINKENIRFVIHYHFPGQMESYLQEIGRAGRDGNRSLAIMLYHYSDLELQKQMIESELPTEAQIDQYYANLQHKNNIVEVNLTETQQRYLDFFSKQIEATDLKSMRKMRIEYKLNKLKEIFTWIHSNDCKRKGLLECYGEEMIKKPDKCCSICGLDVREYYTLEPNECCTTIVDWEKRLYKLLMECNQDA